MESKTSSSMLAPGFRFHPTDEELVRYYLRRKVCGRGFRFDAISEIDIYKFEPWDLPSFSKLKARDLEWYFFSVLDKKYGNGSRTNRLNRATEKGYWKTTGKDRPVYHKSQIVGMKKTLVYHYGRAPKGARSNWVMHEYKLTDLELERAGIAQDAFVLCRVFQKSGSGPKNGEQYGAPFVEEEWEDDVLEVAPKLEDDGTFLDGHDLEQILGSDDQSFTPTPLERHSEDSSCVQGTAESVNNGQKPSISVTNVRAVKHESTGESGKFEKFDCLEFLLDEPYLDTSDDMQNGNEGFIESNDPSNPAKSNTSAFNMPMKCHTPSDATDIDAQQFAYDPSEMLQIDDVISRQALLPLEELQDEIEQSTLSPTQCADGSRNDDASTSACAPDELDSTKYESEFQFPFTKQSSHMFTSSKDAGLRMNSLSQPSSSVHVTAGMIQITNRGDQSLDKLGNFKIVLSFEVSQSNKGCTTLESSVGILVPGKTAVSTLSRGWFCFLCFMMIILYMSFKIGACLNKF